MMGIRNNAKAWSIWQQEATGTLERNKAICRDYTGKRGDLVRLAKIHRIDPSRVSRIIQRGRKLGWFGA